MLVVLFTRLKKLAVVKYVKLIFTAMQPNRKMIFVNICTFHIFMKFFLTTIK